MKLETFFEKFELFAGAPNAVAKMRELVLHLAVHGQLIDQCAVDEPAAQLLNRSRFEMTNLMASGQAKKEKPAAPITGDEIRSLPRGWAWARLVDAGQFINGLAFKPSDWGAVGRPIIRIQNLSGRNLDFNRTAGNFDSSVLIQDGDILVSWSATLDAYIWRGEEGVLNQHIFRVLPSSLTDKRYLYWLLKWVIRHLAESDHAHGLVMSHINRGPFLAHPIPIPPLAEQKRIVAKVDELMALFDRLEAQQQERETRHAALARASLARFAEAPTPANLDFLFHQSYTINPADLRKTILTLAVQGLLVPQDPADKSASELVDQIRGDANGQRKSQRGESRHSIDDEPPYELPATWGWARAEELTQPNQNITYGILKPVWVESGVPTVRVTEMKTGAIDINALPKCASERAAKFSKTTLCDGDLLISKDGTIGKTAFVPPELVGGNITQHMLRFAISKRLDRNFVRICIDAPPCQAWMVGETKGVALKGVNVGDFRRMPLPIPPLAEQHRIVAKVDQLMALVDQLETQLTASRVTAEKLLEAAISELVMNGEQEVERPVIQGEKVIAA